MIKEIVFFRTPREIDSHLMPVLKEIEKIDKLAIAISVYISTRGNTMNFMGINVE